MIERGGLQRRPEGSRLQPPRAGARRRSSRAAGSASAGSRIGHLALPRSRCRCCSSPARSRSSPRRQHHPHRQRHHGLVLARTTRSTATTNASARSSAARRTLIIALQADSPDRLFSRRHAATSSAQVTGDIERVDTVQRVDSLATATIVDAIARLRAATTAASTSARCSSPAAPQSPDEVRRRAMTDDLMRGRPGLGRRHRHRDRRQLRRGPHRRRPRRRHPADPRSRRSAAAAGRPRATTTAAWRSARPTTGSRSTTSASSRRRSSLVTIIADLPALPLVAQDGADDVRRSASACSGRWASTRCSASTTTCSPACSIPLIVVLAIADDVHIMQHWDEARPARRRRGGVQGDGRAPRDAAVRRQRDHRARHAVARHEQRGRGPLVRRSGRRSGIMVDFVDLAGARADAAEPDEAGDQRAAPHERYLRARRCGGSRGSSTRVRRSSSRSR